MAEIATIGDPITCGSFTAEGSSDVFYHGMPVVTQLTPTTTGHGCFPPSILIGPWSQTVFVNGAPVALKEVTAMKPHRCVFAKHGGIVSPPTTPPTTEIE